MPNIASAKKRLRQDAVRREKNRANRSRIRNVCKKVLKAVATGNVEQAEQLYAEATITLDKAGASHLIHKNTAGRKKSRLSAMIKKLKIAKKA